MVDIESKLIERLKKRDEKAFDKIYDKYYKLVYYVSYDILKDASSAEDIMQETFIKLMDNIEDYNEQGNFKQYLLRIAKNLSLNEYKKRQAHEQVILPEEISYHDEEAEKLEVILTLERTLTKEEGKIVEYKVLLDYSFQEIADELNMTLGKVQSQYYIAIKKLKQHFIEKEGV